MTKIRKNEDINFQIEILDGEGMVLVDESNDKMHFINYTGLILWEEINNDSIDRIYDRYRTKAKNIFQIDDENIVKTTFDDFLDVLEKYSLIIRY